MIYFIVSTFFRGCIRRQLLLWATIITILWRSLTYTSFVVIGTLLWTAFNDILGFERMSVIFHKVYNHWRWFIIDYFGKTPWSVIFKNKTRIRNSIRTSLIFLLFSIVFCLRLLCFHHHDSIVKGSQTTINIRRRSIKNRRLNRFRFEILFLLFLMKH
jgi:hypothetical protein